MSISTERLALVAALATGIQTGAAMVATRYVSGDVTPGALGFLRYGVAMICIAPIVLSGGIPRFARRDLIPLMLLGIAQFGLLIALLNFGLERMAAGRAALLFSTFPLMTMALGAAIGQERLTPGKTIGVLLSFLGVAVTLGEGVLAEAGAGEVLGAAAVLASAFCGALCTVLSKPYLGRYPTLSFALLAFASSVVALAGMAAWEGFFTNPIRIDGYGWGAVLFAGCSSAFGYLLWLWALKHISATRVTVFLSLSPATAALLGLLLLGERLTLGTILGILLVAIGLWIATRSKSDPKALA